MRGGIRWSRDSNSEGQWGSHEPTYRYLTIHIIDTYVLLTFHIMHACYPHLSIAISPSTNDGAVITAFAAAASVAVHTVTAAGLVIIGAVAATVLGGGTGCLPSIAPSSISLWRWIPLRSLREGPSTAGLAASYIPSP